MSQDGSNDDELDMFAASLGGSLMKDLLADLAVDEEDAAEWLSLEQLEQELKYLENSNNNTDAAFGHQALIAPIQTTAAGMVVSSQAAAAQAFGGVYQQQDQQLQLHPAVSAMDAWSLSLQNFTASSLEADFLQADSARKSSSQSHPLAPPPGMMGEFAAYDVTEAVNVNMMAPPPGLTPDASQQVISRAAAKLVQELQHVQEEAVTLPAKTPSTAATATAGIADDALVQQLAKGLELISETEALETEAGGDDDGGLHTPPVNYKIPKPSPMTPQNSISFGVHSNLMEAPTPQPTPATTKMINREVDIPMIQMSAPMMPTVLPVMAVALSQQPGRAWQTPPPPPMPMPSQHHQQMHPQSRRVVFANPHPAAAPVPATVLQSRYMSARDISYVVHSMLKPILAAESAGFMSTYHLQYWMRHHPVKPPPPRKMRNDEESKEDMMSLEMDSRYKKAKEWSSEHKVLGQTARTNVARPRALIAVSSSAADTAAAAAASDAQDGSKQRAALWKSRIYCDQAYQCLTTVIEIWQASGAGTPSASVQPHLLKLTKCLGVSVQTVLSNDDDGDGSGSTPHVRNKYSVDPAVLQLLLKLPKGKVLLARVLEQALLPPAVVQVLLPVSLSVLTLTTMADNDNNSDIAASMADDRVFSAWTVVIQTLPDLSGGAILQAVKAVQQHSEAALSSTVRMQCIHALLQRGSTVCAASDATMAAEWTTTEAEFMSVLAGL